MSDQSFTLDSAGDTALAAENAVLRAALADAQQRIQDLEQRADSDSLTGLPNGRRFAAEVERVAGEAKRHGTAAAVVSIDLLGFSALNARHGSLAGDAALVHVARLISGLIRTTDILARTGGDEFGLVLSHLDQNSAIETAERLARCIAAEKVPFGNERIPLRAAVATTGILPGDSPADVLTRAARNLAVAKADG
jgi:diguanylate cyclase (GGDEF)-like protein